MNPRPTPDPAAAGRRTASGRIAAAWLLIAAGGLAAGLSTAAAEEPRSTVAARLVDAVKDERREQALQLLQEGADGDASEVDGTTALMWAAYYGDAELVERLIEAGANVSRTNDYGASAMSEAAVTGSAEVIAALLAAGADPESPLPEGQTALMAAARSGSVDAARQLLAAGADVNARERWGGQSALMWAAAQGHPDMVALLIEHGADPNARGAVRNWKRRVTAEPRPKDMNRGGFTPLLYAARENCIECARYLLAGGADIDLTDPDRVPALGLALMNLHFDFAAFLVGAGADVDRWDLYGRSPLYQAVDMNTLPAGDRRDGGRRDIPSADATTALDVARMLLDAGANPNLQLKLRPPYRNVPFDRGADPLLTTGATPLLRAAQAADVEAIRLLIAHDARVDLPNAAGVTPLMAAAGIGYGTRPSRGVFRTQEEGVAALELLLAAGADIDARANNGRAAVHGAAIMGWNELLIALFENGADLQAADAAGLTPMDFATGNYRAGFLDAPPDPIEETVALLEALLARDEAPR